MGIQLVVTKAFGRHKVGETITDPHEVDRVMSYMARCRVSPARVLVSPEEYPEEPISFEFDQNA